MAKAKAKINRVDLEAHRFLSDEDFVIMTAEERGVYSTILFSLYCNSGRIKYDEDRLRKLCNCKTEFDFQTVLFKFQVRRGWIYNKVVTQKLKEAQTRVDSAVKAANTRWHSQSEGNAVASPAQCQARLSEIISNNTTIDRKENRPKNSQKDIASVRSKALSVFDEILKILFPANKPDRMRIKSITDWVAAECIERKKDAATWITLVRLAKKAAKDGKNPMALFVSLCKSELGYEI